MQPEINLDLISVILDSLGFLLAIIGFISPVWLVGRIRNWLGQKILRFKYWACNEEINLKISMIAHGDLVPNTTSFSDDFSQRFGAEFLRITRVSDKTLHIQKSEFSGIWKINVYDETSETIDDLEYDAASELRLYVATSGVTIGFRQLRSRVSETFSELEDITRDIREILNLGQMRNQYIIAGEGDYSKFLIPSNRMRDVAFDISFVDDTIQAVSVRIIPGMIRLESSSVLAVTDRLIRYIPYQPRN